MTFAPSVQLPRAFIIAHPLAAQILRKNLLTPGKSAALGVSLFGAERILVTAIAGNIVLEPQ